MRAFDSDRIVYEKVAMLCHKHRIESAVETGTQHGCTTMALALMVHRVLTIDIADSHCFLPPNSVFVKGDSGTVLLPSMATENFLGDKILFFLDAHSSIDTDPCPLRAELEQIAQAKLKPPVIVIHDCLVPESDFGYDTYQGQPISYDYVKDLLPAIYPSGHWHSYPDGPGRDRRGCLFVEPVAL